jgi:zinc transport system substrate-binding protein
MSYPKRSLRTSLPILLARVTLTGAALALAPVAMVPAAFGQTGGAGPTIVTDIPATHALTAMVTQGISTPVLLLDRGADPHDFALRPSQARAVANAALSVWMGGELTPWMQRAVQSLSPAAHLELLQIDGLHLQPYRTQTLFEAADAGDDDGDTHGHGHGHDEGAGHGHEDDHAHEDHDHAHEDGHGHTHGHTHGHSEGAGHGHDDDHAHEDHDHAHEDGHGHGHGHEDHAHSDSHGHGHGHGHGHNHGHDHSDGLDPHAWLDIDNAMIWLDAIAARLSDIDPANAAAYAVNAAAGRTRLAALDAELRAILEPVGNAGLVVHHDAYGYLAETYGLNILGSISFGDAATPGAARLSAIRANLAGSGAVCIFPEVNHADAHLRLVAEGTDLRIGAALDPEGVAIDPGPDLYETLMRNLARSIADCVTAG